MMHRFDKGFKMPRGNRCSQAASNVMGGRYANSLWVPKGTKPLSASAINLLVDRPRKFADEIEKYHGHDAPLMLARARSPSMYTQVIGRVDSSTLAKALTKVGEQINEKLRDSVKLKLAGYSGAPTVYTPNCSCDVGKPIGAVYCGKSKVGDILNVKVMVGAKDEPDNSQAPDKDD